MVFKTWNFVSVISSDIPDRDYFSDDGCIYLYRDIRISTNISSVNICSDGRIVFPKLLEADFDIVVSTQK